MIPKTLRMLVEVSHRGTEEGAPSADEWEEALDDVFDVIKTHSTGSDGVEWFGWRGQQRRLWIFEAHNREGVPFGMDLEAWARKHPRFLCKWHPLCDESKMYVSGGRR